jgi:hydroxymethylbilane synthase
VVTAPGVLRLDALVARPNGTAVERTQRQGSVADAVRLGRDAGAELKSRVPADFFAA